MSELLKSLLIYGLLPSIIAFGAFLMKSHVIRLEKLEEAVSRKLEEPQVRQILSDNIIPIKDSLIELKTMIVKLSDQIYDMNRKNRE